MKKKIIALGIDKVREICTAEGVDFVEKDNVSVLADKLVKAGYELPDDADAEGDGTDKDATANKGGDVEVTTAEKMVTVRGMKDHSCVIGGKRYNITKSKDCKVPQGVALILAQSGIVFTIG